MREERGKGTEEAQEGVGQDGGGAQGRGEQQAEKVRQFKEGRKVRLKWKMRENRK